MVLSITGVEALYADMGHFGKFPIRLAWFTVVLPSLVLNYFRRALLLKTLRRSKPVLPAGARLGADPAADFGDSGDGLSLRRR